MSEQTPRDPKADRKDPADFVSWFEVVDAFAEESDRAAVILAAAKLDELLYQLLQATLQPPPSARDELLDTECPLSTFSAKIHLCHRLDLMDARFARALHLVRRIRNSFAHESTKATLDSSPHRDRIRELTALWSSRDELDNLADLLAAGSFKDRSIPAVAFFSAAAVLMLRLQHCGRHVDRIRSKVTAQLDSGVV